MKTEGAVEVQEVRDERAVRDNNLPRDDGVDGGRPLFKAFSRATMYSDPLHLIANVVSSPFIGA